MGYSVQRLDDDAGEEGWAVIGGDPEEVIDVLPTREDARARRDTLELNAELRGAIGR